MSKTSRTLKLKVTIDVERNIRVITSGYMELSPVYHSTSIGVSAEGFTRCRVPPDNSILDELARVSSGPFRR